MTMQRWTADKKEQLASFLQSKVGGSKKQIRRFLEKNCCRINGRIERFGSSWVEKNSVVEYLPPVCLPTSFELLFEHEDFDIVSKPIGWVCDEASCRKTFGDDRFLVHRLDKDTTGALLIAKGSRAKDALMELFAEKKIHKTYLALADGYMREEKGVRDTFLAKKRAFQGQTIWGSSYTGLRAVTRWEALVRKNDATFVLCEPITGRTHQIRVHLAELGHPIIGDRQYAERFQCSLLSPRTLLHAYQLRFSYQGTLIEVQAPLPFDFLQSLEKMAIKHSLAEILPSQKA